MILILLLEVKKKNSVSDWVGILRGPDFKTTFKVSLMLTPRCYSKVAVINSNIYVLKWFEEDYSWFDKKKSWLFYF